MPVIEVGTSFYSTSTIKIPANTGTKSNPITVSANLFVYNISKCESLLCTKKYNVSSPFSRNRFQLPCFQICVVRFYQLLRSKKTFVNRH